MILAITAVMIAASGPGEVQLRWRAPAGCPDSEQLLARMPTSPGEQYDPIDVSAVVQRRDVDHWVLELELSTTSGTTRRRVDASDCRTLADTTAIVTAVYLGAHARPEPEARMGPAAPPLQRPRSIAAPEPEAEPVAPITRPEPDPPRQDFVPHKDSAPPAIARLAETPRRSRVRARDLHAVAYLAGGVGLGVLPGVDLTTSLGLGVFGQRWRTELAASRWFARSEEVGDEVGVEVDMWSGRLAAGPRFTRRNLAFPLLAEVEVGAMHGRGAGDKVVAARDAWAPWVSGGLAAGLSWAAHRNLALWARASGFVSLYRPNFLVGGVGSAFVAGPGGGRLAVGIEVRLPGIHEADRSKPREPVTKE